MKIMSSISKRILDFYGWKVEPSFPKGGPFVCVLYPHTTNWDTIVAFLAGTYWEQKFFIPVKETYNHPVLEKIIKNFNLLPITRDRDGYKKIKNEVEKTGAYPCIATEGTRKKSNGIKPGFYNISLETNSKILLFGCDWKNKTFRTFEPFEPHGTVQETISHIADILEPFVPMGKFPENESPIILSKSEKK